MRRNLSHIIAAAFNEPLLLEPAYARVFFCALGREMGAASLSVPQQQVQLDAPGMLAETDEYMAGGKRPARVYRVVNGIAVLPVTGTLVHRLGGMRPFSGMTGYDGIVACLQQAMADSQVRGVLLDIDSPGGQAALFCSHAAGVGLLPTAGYPDIPYRLHWRDDEPCQLCRSSGAGRCGYHADLLRGAQGGWQSV